MSDKPPRPGTVLEEYEQLPEGVHAEIIDGELHVNPQPAIPHVRSTSRLGTILGPFDLGSGGFGGWVLLDEPELRFERGDILVPDVGGWRRERMPVLPQGVGFTLPPDWVCEVLSPSTELRDRGRKMEIYAREGVKHLWFVNPRARTLEVFALHGGVWERLGLHSGDELVRAEPFEAMVLKLALLWER
ncbi:Uma2 family endonuclease [Myxococcus stipitatus]|uniref:Uma2 family endonuclease n=1 Tax=Myxococcus stipitatus TaxID=83455 RepID=UPI001F171824|nr:Uma2 family endonuclease [Myxococcus stipitatus]MCE9670921.1 Uma2 family endonuclease [Myxococcus stipitatus]